MDALSLPAVVAVVALQALPSPTTVPTTHARSVAARAPVIAGGAGGICFYEGMSLRELMGYARSEDRGAFRQALRMRRNEGATQSEVRDWLENHFCTATF